MPSAPAISSATSRTAVRIFIDKCVIDVFANDRQAVTVWDDNEPGEVRVSLFSRGGNVTARDIKAWTIRSIYEKR